MKSTLTRLLALVLCAVMLLGMLPAVSALAAEKVTTEESTRIVEHVAGDRVYYTYETVTEEKVVPEAPAEPVRQVMPRTIITNECGEIGFETYEDLKELAAGTYTEWTPVYYNGTEDLVITEDLTLPSNFYLYAYNTNVVVPEGITLTANSFIGMGGLDVVGTFVGYGGIRVEGDCTISGTVTIPGYYDLYVDGSVLTITGVLQTGYLQLGFDTVLAGEENIQFNYSYSTITRAGVITSQDELLEAVASIESFDDPNSIYSNSDQAYLEVLGSFTLTESVTIPKKCSDLYFQSDVTVAEGVTLTLNGDSVSLSANLIVEGTLVNNTGYMLTVYYDNGGRLTIGENGTYSGSGGLEVYNWNKDLNDPSVALSGLDLSNFQLVKNESEWARYWELRDVTGLTQLGTPTDLKWGYETFETQTEYSTLVEGAPGMASWATALPDLNEAKIDFYRIDGDTEEFWYSAWHVFGSGYHQEYRAVDNFVRSSPESGTYYFTVTSKGDYTQYYDSEAAVSGTYTYVRPDAQLGTPTNLTWSWPEYSWDTPGDTTNLGSYEIEIYYAPTENAEPWCFAGIYGGTSTTDSMFDELLQINGVGYYRFRVRAISSNIEQTCNSEWSELSPVYNLTELVEGVEAELENIVNDSSLTTEEKIEAVQTLDTAELKTAMSADQNTVDQIAALEAEAGGAATVYVSEDANAFNSSQISIVGANLNTTVDDTEGVTLVIDKPEEEHIIPEAYNNSVAVSFSMDLANVADTENLEVPVQITLPVPENINPGFLVILHYHANGDVEEIWPCVYYDADQDSYFARFVLSSFSDFVMTEYIPAAGDANGDGVVNSEDVARLLWHILFPEMYGVVCDPDVNGDEYMDSADVIYLLWHTLFPEKYTL